MENVSTELIIRFSGQLKMDDTGPIIKRFRRLLLDESRDLLDADQLVSLMVNVLTQYLDDQQRIQILRCFSMFFKAL